MQDMPCSAKHCVAPQLQEVSSASLGRRLPPSFFFSSSACLSSKYPTRFFIPSLPWQLCGFLQLPYADRQPSMSQMERAMETIVKTFHQHSGKKGDPDTLNWDEFKQLVNEDMSNILKKEIKDGKTMSHMMEDFDRNKDGYIEFDEYVALLSNILIKNHKEIYKNASLVTGHGNGT